MDRRRVRALLGLVLAVAAVSAAGGALDAGTGGGGSPGSGGGGGFTTGEGDGGLLSGADLGEIPSRPWVQTLVGAAFAIFVVLTVLALAVGLARDWRGLLHLFRTAVPVLLGIAVLLALLFVLQEVLAELLGGGGGSSGSLGLGGEGSGAGGDESSGTSVDLPFSVVAVVAAVVLLVVGLATLGDGESGSEQATDEGPGSSTAGVAPATPDGASTPSTPHDALLADNEVYRAWLDLADAAGTGAARSSPGDVQRRAIDAGVDESVAREITSMFEAVRYGPDAATPELERRAAAARDELGGESA